MSKDLLNHRPPADADAAFLSPDDLFAGAEKVEAVKLLEKRAEPQAPVSDPPAAFLSPDDLFAAPAPQLAQAPGQTTPAWEEGRLSARPPKRSAGKKAGNLLCHILFYALILAVLAGAALFVFSNNTQRSAFGYRIYTIQSDSMKPIKPADPAADGVSQPEVGGPQGGFAKGDAVIVRLVDPETIRVGDIITFTPDASDPGVALTHRVVQVLDHLNDARGLYFVTQGDANAAPDAPIPATAVIGLKTFTVPRLGAVMGFVQAHLALVLLATAAVLALVILLRHYFFRPEKGAPKGGPKSQKAPKERRRDKASRKNGNALFAMQTN